MVSTTGFTSRSQTQEFGPALPLQMRCERASPIIEEANECHIFSRGIVVMRLLSCRRCRGTIEYVRDTGSGRLPWYCKSCVAEIYVERIKARNIADRARRRAERDPLCRDCRMPLSLTAAAQGATCTPTALPAGQDGKDRRTAAEFARSLEQRRRTK